MNLHERIESWLTSLGVEVVQAQAGSDQGQFPILDLLGNLRDSTASETGMARLHESARKAADTMIGILESGKPFTADQIAWLQRTFDQIQAEARNESGDAAPAPQALPPAAPSERAAPAAGEDGEMPLVMNVESDADLLREFITESREHLDNIEQGVLVLEHSPKNAEMLNTVFRAFHTFKGGAGFLSLVPINRLAHVLESLLDQARQGKLVITSSIIEVILAGRDKLKQFLDEMEAQLGGRKPAGPCVIPCEELKAKVHAILEGKMPEERVPSKPTPPADKPAPAAAAPSVSVSQARPAPPAEPAPAAPAAAPSAPVARGTVTNATIKVDTRKLDGLIDLVGELVIAHSLVAQDLGRMASLPAVFTRNLGQLSYITKELQRVSMSLRMVPIRGVFQKMARLVRDLGAKQHKEVQLVTNGEETELDRNVVEELSDPLMHMIRNSIDHGIESTDARAAKGKPPVGTIYLRAFHQSGNIVVEIEDDGAGLNRDRILAKAIERDLVPADARLTDEAIYAFIFAAGFSTAEKVTDISGRGVGMDVVRRNIEQLRGRIDVSSRPGKGSSFKLVLPLTLAIIDGLVLRVGEERFIIPTLSVRESFRPQPEMISTVQGRGEMVNVRGRLLPLLRLYDYFGLKPSSTHPTDGLVVVVQSGAALRCLLVDQLLHKQEVVIKNLGELIRPRTQQLAGAAILGDGKVGLIVDVNSLVHLPPDARVGSGPNGRKADAGSRLDAAGARGKAPQAVLA